MTQRERFYEVYNLQDLFYNVDENIIIALMKLVFDTFCKIITNVS
jgi:ATP sulfurylase